MALTSSIIPGCILSDGPLFNSVDLNSINFRGTNNSHISCRSPYSHRSNGIKGKSLGAYNVNSKDHIHQHPLTGYDKSFVRKLCRQIERCIKKKFKNICEESRRFLSGSLYYWLLEKYKFLAEISRTSYLTFQRCDCNISANEKVKFLKKFYSILRRINSFHLLSFSLYYHLKQTENYICSCNRLNYLEDFLSLQYYAHSETYGLLHIYSIQELLSLYFVLKNTCPQSKFSSLFSSNIISMCVERSNMVKFRNFLDIIVANMIQTDDLFIICKSFIKLFRSESQPLRNSSVAYTISWADLIPAFYLYFINILKFQEKHTAIFHTLIHKFSSKHKESSFLRDIFTLFKISKSFFLDNNDFDYSVLSSEQTDKILYENKNDNNEPPAKLNEFCRSAKTNKTNKKSVLISTGKEEVDVIDGVQFISFEEEDDLQEFVTKENEIYQQIGSLRDERSRKKSREGRIVPTKTNDITKIKGWRNKLFHNEFSKRSGKTKLEEPFPHRNKSHEDISRTAKIDEEDPLLENFNSEELLQNRLFFKEFHGVIPDVWDICFKEEYSHILDQINEKYHELLERDKFHKKIKASLTEGSEMDGVFYSPLVDEFLEKHSKINVSFDPPKLISMSGMVFNWDENNVKESKERKKCENDLNISLSNETVSCFNFDSQQRNNEKDKFILIRGRPVYLDFENTCKTGEKKKPKGNSKLERGALDHSDQLDITNDLLKHYSSKNLTNKNVLGSGLQSKSSFRKSCMSLLDACKSDDSDEVYVYSRSSRGQKFPLIFPCSSDEHSFCFESVLKDMKLGMILTIGKERPLSNEAIANLELLKRDPVVIDECWANIAASALQQTNKGTIKRILVPVRSQEVIEIGKLSLECISEEVNVENEIKNVMFDLVDYVVRKEHLDKIEYSYDPDFCTIPKDVVPLKKNKKSKVERELRRLINVTLVEESRQNGNINNDCGKEHCSKGCVCSSLNGPFSVVHCGKEKCMFNCTCGNGLSRRDVSSHRVVKTGLAKEESSWHQTVICKSDDVIIQGDTGKSKREKKLPTRYRNNVLIGKEMNCLDLSPHSISNWRHFKTSASVPKPSKDQTPKGQLSKETTKDSGKKTEVKPSKVELKGVEMKNLIASRSKEPVISPPTDLIKKSLQVNTLKRTNDSLKRSSDSVKEYSSPEKKKKKKKKKKTLKSSPPVKKTEDSDISISNELSTLPDWDEESLLEMEEVDIPPEEMLLAKEDHPLNIAFIWCAVHSEYFCQCFNKTYFLKNNVLCRNKHFSLDVSLLELSSALTNSFNFSVLHLFDRHKHCARTYGSPFDYSSRNKSPAYRSKRELEIKNCIFSNTNSLVKLDFGCKVKNILPKNENCRKRMKTNIPLEDIVDLVEQETKSNLEIDEQEGESSNNKNRLPDNSSENNLVSSHKLVDLNADLTDVINDIDNEHPISDEETQFKSRTKYRIGPAYSMSKHNVRPTIPQKSKSGNLSVLCSNEKTATSPIQEERSSKTVSGLSPTRLSPTTPAKVSADGIEVLPSYGLLCLTEGFGYLPVNCFTSYKVSVRDPLIENMYHNFKDIESANFWLNKFFKSRLLFEDANLQLKWVIVKENLLKKLKEFDKNILEDNLKIVNKNGLLIDRSKYSEKYLQSIKMKSSEAGLSSDFKRNKNSCKRFLENEESSESSCRPIKRLNTNSSNYHNRITKHSLPPQVSRKRPDITSLRSEFQRDKFLPAMKFREDSP